MYIFTEKRKTDIRRLRAAQVQAEGEGDVVKAAACRDAIDAELDDVLSARDFIVSMTQ